MITKEILINNKSGLNSKPAALFIHKASNYKSTIWIENNERKANAKSLLGVLSLGISSGTKVILTADGEDEETALAEVVSFLEKDMEESV